ncbi:MAG: M23 family metallopeptidase [Thermodesulfobacteriota bacterium]
MTQILLIILLLLTTGMAAPAENGIRIESFPKVAKQGDVCLIRASGPASLKSIHGEFRGEIVPIAYNEETGAYEGLIGIDMSTRPATYEVKVMGKDEESRVYSNTLSLKVEKADFGSQVLSLPPHMVELDAKTLERVNQEAKKLEALFQTFRDERLWRGIFIRPVEGEVLTGFGLNRIINKRQRSQHTGVDLRAKAGTPVQASNHGVVVLVDELFFSGKSVVLDHGWGFYSMYFHLSEVLVREKDRVSRGALLGRAGSTGRSTGPHLHWGMRIRGARVDPLTLLSIGALSVPPNHLPQKD